MSNDDQVMMLLCVSFALLVVGVYCVPPEHDRELCIVHYMATAVVGLVFLSCLCVTVYLAVSHGH